jgi:hypothetical protein
MTAVRHLLLCQTDRRCTEPVLRNDFITNAKQRNGDNINMYNYILWNRKLAFFDCARNCLLMNLFLCCETSYCRLMCKTYVHRIAGAVRRRRHTLGLPLEPKLACVCPSSNAQSPWALMQAFHLSACVSAGGGGGGWLWRNKQILSGGGKK